MVAYETGFRLGDMLNLHWPQIRPDGRLIIVQKKTQKSIQKTLSPGALAALSRISLPLRERPFGGVLYIRRQYEHFGRIVKAAGLTGSSQKIRRTSGTMVEKLHPGEGHKHLGNGEKVFRRYYLDQTLLTNNTPAPPPLL